MMVSGWLFGDLSEFDRGRMMLIAAWIAARIHQALPKMKALELWKWKKSATVARSVV